MTSYIDFPSTATDFIEVDDPSLDTTTNVAYVIQLNPETFTPAAATAPVSKWGVAGQQSWLWWIDTAGNVLYTWFDLGGVQRVSVTTTPPPWSTLGATPWLMIFHDLDNGAGGVDISFYTSKDGVQFSLWQKITPVGVPPGNIRPSTTTMKIGVNYKGRIGHFQMRQGVAAASTPIFRLEQADIPSSTVASFQAATGQTVDVQDAGGLVFHVDPITLRVNFRPPDLVAWSVDLCRKWRRIATCESYQFIGQARRLERGDWTLNASPRGIIGGEYLWEGETVTFDPRDVDTIRVVAEGQVAYPGTMVGQEDQFRMVRNSEGMTWQWKGSDAWAYFDKRLAYPDPTTEEPWATSHDVRTGIASHVISEFIAANMGTAALADRAWDPSDIAIDDPGVGGEYTFSARLQTLEELISRIARDAAIEVIPNVDFNGVLRIVMATARDLSDFLVLSDQGDIERSEMMTSHRRATRVLTAGQGDLTARLFRSADTGATGRDRLEVLSEQGNMENVSELQADADQKLALAAEQYAILTQLTPQQASDAIKLGLRIGDKLSVIVQNRRYRVPIEGMAFDITAGRQILRPVLGSAMPGMLQKLLDSMGKAERRRAAVVG